MDHREQIAHFENQLKALIGRTIREYDLTLADALGTIECVKLWLYTDQTSGEDEESDSGA